VARVLFIMAYDTLLKTWELNDMDMDSLQRYIQHWRIHREDVDRKIEFLENVLVRKKQEAQG
jgi:hypothetical protein